MHCKRDRVQPEGRDIPIFFVSSLCVANVTLRLKRTRVKWYLRKLVVL